MCRECSSSSRETTSRDRFVRKPCTPCYFGQPTQFRARTARKWDTVGQPREDSRFLLEAADEGLEARRFLKISSVPAPSFERVVVDASRGTERGERGSRNLRFSFSRSSFDADVSRGCRNSPSLPEVRVYFWPVLGAFFWQSNSGIAPKGPRVDVFLAINVSP